MSLFEMNHFGRKYKPVRRKVLTDLLSMPSVIGDSYQLQIQINIPAASLSAPLTSPPVRFPPVPPLLR